MKEEWKEIKDYPDYEVSNLGNVMSLKWNRKKMLKLSQQKGKGNRQHYQSVWIKDIDNKWKKVKVHRLVGQAFINNPERKSQINHLDGNGINNVVSNLEWCTNAENIQHAYKAGRVKQPPSLKGSDNNFSKLKEQDVARIIELSSQPRKISNAKIGRMFGVCRESIRRILIGKNWAHLTGGGLSR